MRHIIVTSQLYANRMWGDGHVIGEIACVDRFGREQLCFVLKTFIKSSVVTGICHSTRPCIFSVFWETSNICVKRI